MKAILAIYLRGKTTLEDLPYVSGYCGEFCDGILQQAGPHRIPGKSESVHYLYIMGGHM